MENCEESSDLRILERVFMVLAKKRDFDELKHEQKARMPGKPRERGLGLSKDRLVG